MNTHIFANEIRGAKLVNTMDHVLSSVNVKTSTPRRHGIRETILRALARGPVDTALTQRATWMLGEFNMQRYLIRNQNTGVEPLTVVSIGSGNGHELLEMARLFPGSKIMGLDPDDYFSKPVAKRTQTVDASIKYLEVSNRAEDMQDIQSHSADGVTLNFVLHHIDTSLHDQIFNEIKRVLKSDGYLFIVEDLVDSEVERKMVEREDRKINMEILSGAPHNYRSANEWREYFKRQGFEMIEAHEVKPQKVRHGFFTLRQTVKR